MADSWIVAEIEDGELMTWESCQSTVPSKFGKSQTRAGDVLRF